ncbi:ATPase domain-containing protein [Pseudoduganella aquatica]|uniref:non-specific serine/threonine protein kinase n=1 Tax=Pseudoduganella aquatica TaxID=2660641 RepID=A0A7X4H8K8_9BURK|nr:ATPase domain-containing protein [Pseudoduganella aquatica]MYN06244.1 AAA family ATPase [Pseudoduganella aquatica]
MITPTSHEYLATGVPGLDTLLGGGLSEYSFNVIAGSPGSGKTTLAHQIMFALASANCKALFFTVLGEPPLKMLRYQQRYSFFDVNKVEASVRYVNLADDLRAGDFSGVLARIMQEVASFEPRLVFVDSFRSVIQTARQGNEGIADLQQFVQELGTSMASWQATTFLIGEYSFNEIEAHPVMTVADGLICLAQHMEGNAVVRKMRVVKMRGHAHMGGAHTFRITGDGLKVYPRTLPSLPPSYYAAQEDGATARVGTGIAMLDELLNGGLPQGHAALVVGPSGSGKTILATAFLEEGARQGGHGVLASFEKMPSHCRNHRLAALIGAGQVTVVATRSLDLSIENVLDDLVQEIARTGATRVVIDSLSELGLSLAPEFAQDFRASIFRVLATLAALNVTVLVTMGMEDRFTDMRFSLSDTSFLADAIIAMRYAEIGGRLQKVISVVKVRGSGHSTDLRNYTISDQGIEIGAQRMPFEGLLSGHPSASRAAQ